MTRLTVCLLFLSCVFCPATGQTHSSYDQMEPRLKRFVDMALVKANRQLSYGHLNFFAIGDVAQLTPRVKIDVRLKNTVCRKAPGANDHRQRPECAFKLLQVRCFVCSADPNTSDPYIDCVRHAEQRTRYAAWDKHCLGPSSGTHFLVNNKDIDDDGSGAGGF